MAPAVVVGAISVVGYTVVVVLVVLCSPGAVAPAAVGAAIATVLLLLACPTTNCSIIWLPHIHQHLRVTNYRNPLSCLLVSSSSSVVT